MSRLPAKDRKLLERICDKQLTHLARPRLVSVVETCRAIEEERIPGAFLEIGCGLGGSSIMIAIAKYPKRPLRVYDEFESEETGKDAGDPRDLLEVVLANFKSFGVEPQAKSVTLVKGPPRETLRINKLVAFAHIDAGGYEPVMACLTRILPKLAPGGSIILDDYHDWGGCRDAADECLKGFEHQFAFDDSAGSRKLTKLAR